MREDIPTIGELEQEYSIKNPKLKDLKTDEEIDCLVETQGSFFKRFRKTEVSKDYELEKNLHYLEFKTYMDEGMKKFEDEIEDIKNRIEYEKFFLEWEKSIAFENLSSRISTSTPETRYRSDRIKDYEKKLENLINGSRESWIYTKKQELEKDVACERKGDLIQVPYVLDAKERIRKSLKSGMPVYLVGHLGSGKTKIAEETATEYIIQNRVQEELQIRLEAWYEKNPLVTEDQVLIKFKVLKNEIESDYLSVLENGSEEEIKELKPLFISGSHNLTYEDMFVEKTLSLKQSFSKGSYKDYLDIIEKDFFDWIDEHGERLSTINNEELLQLKIQIWKSFSDLLVAKNSAFGTEVEKIPREILIAVQEGRPVIVDELNTIAMQNLIGLNDILQRKVGSTAYITGVGPVKIKKGFGFIGTGNLSTDFINYEGTNELNPAFKSRFTTLEYNYVPQKTSGYVTDDLIADENQLFRMVMVMLVDEDLSLSLPNIAYNIDEIYRLCQLSRLTQEVFMGRLSKEDELVGIELREAVLSVRNILFILKSWNKGEDCDLSKAIWDGFISSITNPDDQNYILSQAVRFGFFKREDGWNIVSKESGDMISTYEEIRTSRYECDRGRMETYGYFKLLDLIYGRSPEYIFTEELRKQFQIETDIDRAVMDKYMDLDRKVTHLERSVNILDRLKDGEE